MACCKENRIYVSEVVIIRHFIGIDLGTSAVKLLLVDEQGQIEREVTKEYPLIFPHPGWSEQNPEDWWKAVQHGILQLTEHIDKSTVCGRGRCKSSKYSFRILRSEAGAFVPGGTENASPQACPTS